MNGFVQQAWSMSANMMEGMMNGFVPPNPEFSDEYAESLAMHQIKLTPKASDTTRPMVGRERMEGEGRSPPRPAKWEEPKTAGWRRGGRSAWRERG
ncbi:hypothetical protein COCNU_14G006670 [Cocos nucifera]|uniref:Uncharacterized protein n=1 Tax=Cocos nucifera TaxID=13894 RepID=A0A8K0NC71_COCNU|nr:hypothetical protein COCNU_14G006670 [Cocos nucifera]